MIGGVDFPLSGPVVADDMDVLLRGARAEWPEAVVEDGAGNFVVVIDAALRMRWSIPSEAFIYENRAAYESWTACGLTHQNAHQMVSVSLESDCISFVVSDLAAPSASIVAGMVEGVEKNRWLARVAQEIDYGRTTASSSV